MFCVTGFFAHSVGDITFEPNDRMHHSHYDDEWDDDDGGYYQEFFSAKELAELLLAAEPPNAVNLLPFLTYDPEAREQGDCGSCWIWAGNSAISIRLAKVAGLYEDFSVQYVISLLNDGGKTGEFACDGGDAYSLAEFYMSEGNKQLIPVNNRNAQYIDGDGGQSGGYRRSYMTNMPAEMIGKTPYYSIHDMYVREFDFTQPQDVIIRQMKGMLSQGYPIMFSYYIPSEDEWDEFELFWDDEAEDVLFPIDTWDGMYFDEEEGGDSHSVLIVGYDATDPDHNNHYWILLNSWGAPENRQDGTVRIPMYINYKSQAPNLEYLNFDGAVIFTDFVLDTISPTLTPTIAPSIIITDPQTLISLEDGSGYTWSEDKALLTITDPGSYGFANTTFGDFTIYIDVAGVSLDGRFVGFSRSN
jgi:hypothetical protein